jgi:hypothetical protein
MLMRIAHFIAICAMALALPSCVSIDSRASSEPIDKSATGSMSGEFSNHASYRSTGEFLARDNLADLLNVPARNAERVRIALDRTGTLSMTWLVGTEEKASRSYSRELGLIFAADGSIELPSKGSFVSGEGAAGYQSLNVRLFVNASGDLATIQSGGGGGLLGPIPMGIYAKHLAIFPRQR